jgi:peptidoglycan/LPS O-acetylase OafA/YrhL
MAAHGSERLHALDAVRGFALLAGIVFHATLSFLPHPKGIPLWIVSDSQPSLVLAGLFHVLHIFRMTVFFLIAGFFARLAFNRRGAKGFIADRLKRIGIPLVAGWPILFAAIAGVTIWAAIRASHGAPLPPPPKYAGFPAFPLTHLWFLYVLLLLYAAVLIVRLPVALIDRSGCLRRGVDAALRPLVRNPLGLIVLAAPTAAALYSLPEWRPWFGIPTPDSSLVPNLGAAVAFASAFGFGWLLHRQVDLLEVWRRRWPLNLALAIGFTAAELSITGIAPAIAAAAPGLMKLASAATFTLAIWSWSFALIGLALQFLANESPARRYIADASYWLYLIHLPIVMVLQVLVAPLDWPWPAKFAVILGVAFPLMFASYQFSVRHSCIGALLAGRRRPKPVRKAKAASPATADSSTLA